MENKDLEQELQEQNQQTSSNSTESIEEDLKIIIAKNIIKFRKRAKLTQAELAEKLNYSDKAISKWERGASLPDIIVLNDIAKLFNVTLDSLVSNKEEKVKKQNKILQKIYSNKFIATACASFLVWLVATCTFFFLSVLTNFPNLWMTFVYAIPANCIVCLSLQYFWKSHPYYNFLFVCLLFISIAVAVYLSLNIFLGVSKIWLIFIILVPLLILTWLWFIGRHKLKLLKNKLNFKN